jgi:hypothetical protein
MQVNGAGLQAYVPQVFGESPIPITAYMGEPPSTPGMGWVMFQGGNPEFPVWLGVSVGGDSGGPGVFVTRDYRWQNIITATDPGHGFIKVNNLDPALATFVYMSLYDRDDNAYITATTLQPGDLISVYLSGDINTRIEYVLSAALTNNGNLWLTLPVTVSKNQGFQSGTPGNNVSVKVVVQVTGHAAPIQPMPGGSAGDVILKNTSTPGDASWTKTIPNLTVTNLTAGTIVGAATATTLRATSSTELDLASTAHGLQIGPSAGINLAADMDEIQARNNGAASALNLNPHGGTVTHGGALAAVLGLTAGTGETSITPTGLTIPATGHATSRRAGITLGTWQLGQDLSANGGLDWFLWNGASRIGVTAAGAVSMPGTVTTGPLNAGAISAASLSATGAVTAGGRVTGAGFNMGNAAFNTDGNYIHLDSNSAVYLDGDNIYFRSAAGAQWGYWDLNGLKMDANRDIYWTSWGGGWGMTDSTYMRTTNGKSIWIAGGAYACDGSLRIGMGGSGTLINAAEKATINGGPCTVNYKGFLTNGNKGWNYAQFVARNDNGGGVGAGEMSGISFNNSSVGIAPLMRVLDNGEECLGFTNNPNTAYVLIRASAFTVTSTIREKENIRKLNKRDRRNMLKRIKTVKPIKFRPKIRPQTLVFQEAAYQAAVEAAGEETIDRDQFYVSEDHDCGKHGCKGTADNPCLVTVNDRDYVGISAEDLAKVLPEAAHFDEEGLPDGFDTGAVSATAFALVGELLEYVEELETRIEALEPR